MRLASQEAFDEAACRSCNIGEYTLKDILSEIEKPGRDPRERGWAYRYFRSIVLEDNDLRRSYGAQREQFATSWTSGICGHRASIRMGSCISPSLSDEFVKSIQLDSVRDLEISLNVRVLSVDEKRERSTIDEEKGKMNQCICVDCWR